jgi:hypothetical protein
MADRFHIRTATSADISALRALIERSVRGLQQNDYTPAQIEGALPLPNGEVAATSIMKSRRW